jgi:cell division transport system ATP-binding protein
MIHFENVTKRYSEGRAALHNVSLELPSGEFAFLTGHSGAGKSTLLKLIALIERPTRGQVFVDGRNIGRLAPRQVPQHRRKIGIVFQDNKLLEDRPAFDNVALPLVIAGFNRREIARRTRAALDQVGLLDKVGSAPRRLSAGEQQRVGIARAIASKPKLLIADEPTGNLDPELSLGIMNLFRRLNEVGVTMLIATHDLTLLEQLDARKIELADGEVIDRGNST